MVVRPRSAEWNYNGSYADSGRLLLITIVLHQVAPSGIPIMVVTPIFTEWYASKS